MPFKFWKKDKPADRPSAGEDKEAEPHAEAPSEVPTAPAPEVVDEPSPPPEAALAPGSSAAVAVAVEIDPAAVVRTIHEGLVELGLVAKPTKDIFAKKVAAYPGGLDGFLEVHETEPWKPTTQVLAGWLALRANADFDPEALLEEVNPRLSSFGMSIAIEGLSWLDAELGLRKAKLRLADRDRIVRFKDPRDFLRGVNELVATKKLALIELETWGGDDLAFLLVRDPKWLGLADTDLVVVKDSQTATGGECAECGAKVGKRWYDCLSCGAVFG